MENAAKLLEDSLLIIWNDRNAENRLAAMKAIYASDIVFYESDESSAYTGHKTINDLVTKLQEGWHPQFRFALKAPAAVNHDVQYISWTLGIPGQPPVASGMDIAIITSGKIQSLHLFLDVPTQ